MKVRSKYITVYICLGVALLLLFCGGLLYGAVRIPIRSVLEILAGTFEGRQTWVQIVMQSRLPQTITALFAGASLAVSGLLLQTLFKILLPAPRFWASATELI